MFLIFYAAQLLDVDSVLFCETLQHRGLIELLTTTEFLHDASLLEFTLEFLQGALDVLAFLYGYYNHVLFLLNRLINNVHLPPIESKSGAKVQLKSLLAKDSAVFFVIEAKKTAFSPILPLYVIAHALATGQRTDL